MVRLDEHLQRLRLNTVRERLEALLQEATKKGLSYADFLDGLFDRGRDPVLHRETHTFLQELAEATLAETRKDYLAERARAHLLIIDDLGMGRLPHTAAEDLLELILRRYERASTMLTSNRPVDEWGKLLADTAAVTALLDRLLHHAHVLKCRPRSWGTRVRTTLPTEDAVE